MKKNKIKEFGQVFTPVSLVNEMLDKLPKELWSDPAKTWIDNSAGEGAFLIEVKKRLMEGLKDKFKTEDELEKHILENMIFGIEKDAEIYPILIKNLFGDKNYKQWNFYCGDALTYDYTFGRDIGAKKFFKV